MPKVAKTLMGIFAEDVAWDKEEEEARMEQEKAAQEQVVIRKCCARTCRKAPTRVRRARLTLALDAAFSSSSFLSGTLQALTMIVI